MAVPWMAAVIRTIDMLVINRGLYQSVKLGDDITIKVLRFYEWDENGRKVAMVSIGIDAPPEVQITRDNARKRSKSKLTAGVCASYPAA